MDRTWVWGGGRRVIPSSLVCFLASDEHRRASPGASHLQMHEKKTRTRVRVFHNESLRLQSPVRA